MRRSCAGFAQRDPRYACVFCIASRRSSSLVMLYRSKITLGAVAVDGHGDGFWDSGADVDTEEVERYGVEADAIAASTASVLPFERTPK